MGLRLRRASLVLGGVAALVVVSIILESEVGLPFDTTLRLACAAMCLLFIFQMRADYPGERWVNTGFWFAFAVNVALFSTPLMSRPASRGEIMIFALPDAIVVLAVRIASYPVADAHQRAMRQQMILGVVVAILFCILILGGTLMEKVSASP